MHYLTHLVFKKQLFTKDKFLKRLNTELSLIQHSIPTYLPKRNENICPHKNFYTNVLITIILNSQKETTQMFINWWMDKQNMMYSYNRILGVNKKERTTDINICHNMEELWKYAKWKKPDTKDHMLPDSIYTECPKQANP